MRIGYFLLALLGLFVLPAEAQQTILQSGPVAPRRAPMYGNQGSQPILQDSGPAGGGPRGSGLSEQLLIAPPGPGGVYPGNSSGSGPKGANWCNYDAPIDNATGYHYICLSPNINGGATIAAGSGGGAPASSLNFNVNGVNLPFPLSANGPYLTTLQNNAALKNTPTTAAPSVQRLGFYASGDAPPLVYTASGSACSLNGGNGDDGSQVKSVDNKCWIANFPAKGADVRQWGCTASSTDNTACLQAAINAMYKNTLLIIGGPYLTGPLVATDQITIVGNGGDNGIYTNTCSYGLRQKSPNTDVLTLQFGGTVQSLCIDQNPGNVNSTGGFGLRSVANVNFIPNTNFVGNTVYNSCNGISVTATPTGQMLEPLLLNNLAVPYPNNNCNAYVIGDLSVAARTGNVKFIGNSVYCGSSASTGLLVKDSGGLYTQDSITSYLCNIGMAVTPGVGQFVNYSQIGMGPMADSSVTAGILIDPKDSTSVMFGNSFNGTWASNTTGGPNVLVRNTGNTTSAVGLYFRNMTSFLGANQSGFDLGGTWRSIAIQNTTICNTNAGNPGTAIIVGGNVSDTQITGNTISTCGGFSPGILANGISITTSATDIGMVSDNVIGSNVYPVTNPFTFAPTGSLNFLTFILGQNKGVSNIVPGFVPAAATVSLPVNSEVFLSGSANITNMVGAIWPGRTLTIRLQTSSTVNFAVGGIGTGVICNNKTITQFQSVTATYNAGDSCWFIQGP